MKKLLLLIPSVFFFQILFSQTYTFTGNGLWTVTANWNNNTIPPVVLPAGDTIIISPAVGDSCVLDVAQRISQGAIFIVSPGANFIIHSTLNISDGKPLVITTPVIGVSGCQAWLGGNVLDSSSAPVTSRGIVWSTTPDSVTIDRLITNGTGVGAFSSTLVNLFSSTTYYARAFATNALGTTYGNEISFTTAQPQYFVNTKTVVLISANAAQSGAIIDNTDQVCPNNILTEGVVWDTTPNPMIELSTKTNDGGGQSSYNSYLENLQLGTTYYLRAYAIVNGIGPVYGSQVTFTTRSSPSWPTVLTDTVSAITDTSAVSGVIIVRNGGSTVITSGLVWDTLSSPTISLSTKTTNSGIIMDTFINNITGLRKGKIYYVRAYATSSAGTGYGGQRTFISLSPDSTFTDPRDGQSYTFRHIGTQVWMTKNLNYITDSGSYCYNNDATNCSIYGRLYNWNTALTVAPPGWHLPSDTEWQTLINYLGGSAVAGGKMKEAGTAHWISPNTGADNTSSFSGLPGGSYYTSGVFDGIGTTGNWWSSTESNTTDALYCYSRYLLASIVRSYNGKSKSYSVRCVRN